MSGKVYFIGAGPGDPDLLTRKACRILSAAEVVLHDALVPPEILLLAPGAETVRNVGKRCGKKTITQQELHALMVGHAAAGRIVARLQGGDPSIFGRAGEEIAALREAEIDFEIVPGVTAACAAAASAQVSLTRRGVASKLIFLSAHRCPAGATSNWEPLPVSDATLAIYMPGGSYEDIARQLLAGGLAADTPCLIVSQASTDQEMVLRMDLASLAQVAPAPAPALLMIGEVTRAEARELAASAISTSNPPSEAI